MSQRPRPPTHRILMGRRRAKPGNQYRQYARMKGTVTTQSERKDLGSTEHSNQTTAARKGGLSEFLQRQVTTTCRCDLHRPGRYDVELIRARISSMRRTASRLVGNSFLLPKRAAFRTRATFPSGHITSPGSLPPRLDLCPSKTHCPSETASEPCFLRGSLSVALGREV